MEGTFAVDVELKEEFRFEASFADMGGVVLPMDEPEPTGTGEAPNAARVAAAAIGNCLSASLLFCLRKARVDVGGMRTRVEGEIGRNESGRLRLQRLRVSIVPKIPSDQREKVARCRDVFEDFCIVTESVRQGLPVDVAVEAE